ncbi:hypothetical protein Tco_0047127 [Tanacetum coccineum]
MELYYSRFYKLMNEMIRNNLTVATMQVNVQFLQQLQPKWSRFITIVKQQHKLDEVSYHKLFDILKQYQKEVNEIRAERIAKNANPLAIVATAQPHQDPYYQTSKSHKSYAPTSKTLLPTISHATTRHKGKEIAKPITPPSESASEEDSDPKQAQKDKEMQKNLALIAKYKNDNHTGQFGNQRTMTVVGARETEYKKPKRVKDSTHHKEKMLLCKQAEKGVPLQAEQSDWLADTDEEIGEQELEAHYSYMAKIQEVPTADSGTDSEPLEQNDQNDVECDDERVAFASLIANLKLDVDENKKIQKQLKKANTTLAHELTECKSILAETSRTLEESNSIQDSCLVALQNKQTEFERYKNLNDHTVDYEKLEHKLNETLGLLAQKDIDIKEGLKLKAYEISVVKEKHDELVKQSLLTKSHYEGLVKDKTKDHFRAPTTHDMEILIKTCLMPLALKTQNDSFAFVHKLKQEMHADLKYPGFRCTLVIAMYALSSSRKSKKTTLLAARLGALKLKLGRANKLVKLKDKKDDKTSNVNAVCATCGKCMFNSNHDACVSKYLNDVNARTKKPKVVPISTRKPNSQANKSVATHPKIVQLILFIIESGCTKHMTGNLSLLCNFVEKYLGTVHFGNDQFAPILGYGDLVQGNITINRVYYIKGIIYNIFLVGQFCDADLEVAFQKSTCFVKDLQGNDLLAGNRGYALYKISLQETNLSTPICLIAKASPTQAWL